MSAASDAVTRATHAARWQRGQSFEGELVEGVAVVSEWHVVLYLPSGLVRLDPDDNVVWRSSEHELAEATVDEPPAPGPRSPSGQQELF